MIKEKSTTSKLELNLINSNEIIEENEEDIIGTVNNKKITPFKSNLSMSQTPHFSPLR